MKPVCAAFLLLLFLNGNGQVINRGPIEIHKNFFGTGFWGNDRKLTNAELMNTLSAHPAAHTEMKKARANQAFSTVFSFAGGALIGWPIGTAAGGGDPNWTLAAVGAGLVAIAIPFEIAFNKKAKNAISLYNSSLQKSSGRKPVVNLGISANRARLVLHL
ncbi:MAG: hypothetical protein HZA79_12750 [Sphingobacteriales bacterium]|nr:hypothetical protein [Sphingobacteriales bacterium]